MAFSFTRSLDHTQRRTTVDRTPQLVAETSTWQNTTLTTDRHPCPPVGFEPTISAGDRTQTYALDRAATGTGLKFSYKQEIQKPAVTPDKNNCIICNSTRSALVGYCTGDGGNSLTTFRDNLSVPPSRFLDSWPLKMGPIGRFETPFRIYRYTLCNSPEERSSHQLRGGSLKSRIVLQVPL